MYYSATGMLALLILLIENQDILFTRKGAFDQPAWGEYRKFLTAVLVYYVADILWGFLESRKLTGLLFADTSFYFIAMAVGVLFWTRYAVAYLMDRNKFGRLLVFGGRALAAAVAGITAVNVFVPVLFTVDENCVYHALPLRYIILVAHMGLLLTISAYTLYARIKRRKQPETIKKYRTVSFFGLIMTAFLLAQLYYPYLPLYAVAYLLGTCLLRAVVIFDEKEDYRLKLEETQKVAELKQSIASLLDNMPVLSFSKDAKTGAYLACNQAFATYAHRETPEDVAGLTDAQIFDPATAAHFTADDKKALAMEKPYIFFEDAPDAAGNPRQFQTTKLKFLDANGRQCLLGMSLDVTEIISAKKESEEAKAAYQEAKSASAVYESIVDSLTEDYFDLFYIDLETDDYVEYSAPAGSGSRAMAARKQDFFRGRVETVLGSVWEEDRPRFLEMMNKERLLEKIRKHGACIFQCRLLIHDAPTWVLIKATTPKDDERHMIVGVNNVDSQIRDRMAARQAAEAKRAYTRLSALTSNLIVTYVVDLETEQFTEVGASRSYEGLGIEKRGSSFFETTRKICLRAVHPEDRETFLSLVTKENILRTIAQDGGFILDYRLMGGELPTFVRLRAARMEEDGKSLLIVGLLDVDAQVRLERERAHDLSAARIMATRDALTGVKNRHAFLDAQKQLDEQIQRGECPPMAMVVCDINDLKRINDYQGHAAGDQYIRRACSTICVIFKHSPVFRIGGDEFSIICQGHDYLHIDELLESVEETNRLRRMDGDVQIACGMARLEENDTAATVFERADQRMYARKAQMKG